MADAVGYKISKGKSASERSPDERSDIQGDVGVVLDVAALIQATCSA
jgi:hypothetical protein